MQIYLAPLQGLTDWIFRESFHENIGAFDKYFSPFIRVQDGQFFRPSQCRDILPEHNCLQKPVPQFLGNDADSFKLFEELCARHGYTEANINLGCPFTKVAKNALGAGLLSQPGDIARLFQHIFASTTLKLSVKCRLGQEDASEFEKLVPVFNDFPLVELIIHPRTARQMYKGEIYYDAFARHVPRVKHPVCYNGDIVSAADIDKIKELSPGISRFMVGRGILYNPFLLSELRQQTDGHEEKMMKMKAFHLGLIERCMQKYSGDMSVLKRFEEMWTYHSECYDDGRKILKQVKKCHTLAQYESVAIQAVAALK